MDFITAAHELFRRYSDLLRSGPLVQGLYIGMAEAELREYLEVHGEEYLVEVIETAQVNGGHWEDEAGRLPPQLLSPSVYHVSVWHLVDRHVAA